MEYVVRQLAGTELYIININIYSKFISIYRICKGPMQKNILTCLITSRLNTSIIASQNFHRIRYDIYSCSVAEPYILLNINLIEPIR
jgi:hypothetical protein